MGNWISKAQSNAEGSGSDNKPLKITTNWLGHGNISSLNRKLLICDVVASAETRQEKEDSILDMEVDVFNHSQLEVSNLNGDPLSCNDIGSIQTTHGKPDAEIDVSQSVLEKTYRVQNDDYKINDIVWAKIGKYPFWPSIVCVHPISNTYIKTSSKF